PPGNWKGIKALTGGTSNLRDVLDNMVSNAGMLIDAAVKNEARARVTDLAALKGGARFLARIPAEDRRVQVHTADVERTIMQALGVSSRHGLTPDQQAFLDQIISNMGQMTSFWLHNQAPLGSNIVAVLDAGKPVFYEVAD